MDHTHGPSNKYGCNTSCLLLVVVYTIAVGAAIYWL